MRVELKALQRRVGITFVFVTHDQEKALGMSDRLAVFNHGRIEQIGTPQEVYERPATEFVAGFVGVSNILSPMLAKRYAETGAPVSIRPERILLERAGATARDGECSTAGRLIGMEFPGATTRYEVALDDGGEMTVTAASASQSVNGSIGIGDAVRLSWRRDDLRVPKPSA